MQDHSPSRALCRRRMLVLLGTALVWGVACRQESSKRGSRTTPPARTRPAKHAKSLPTPLTLPKDPPVLLHIERPDQVFARLGAWLGQSNRPEMSLKRALERQIKGDVAQIIAGAVALDRAWTVVHLADRTEIWSLPLQPAREQSLQQLLAGLPAEGTFGAHRLPAAVPAQHRGPVPAGRWMAWMDSDAPHTLSISTSTRGLVSAMNLDRTYSDHDVQIVGDARLVRDLVPLDLDVNVQQVAAHGSIKRIEGTVQVQGAGGRDPLAGLPIAAGTLGSLIAHPHGAVAATSRYTQHDQAVAQIMAQVRHQVDRLPMLVQGIGEDLARKLKGVLTQWEGRTLVGTGPSRHLRVAFGVRDAASCERQLNDLLTTLDANLEMASSFVEGLPAIGRQGTQKVGNSTVHRLKIRKIKSQVPRELAGVLNGDGTLHAAYAALPSEGAMLMVLGERAGDELAAWLSAHREGTRATRDELLVATCAVDPSRFAAITTVQNAMAILLTAEAQPGHPAATLTVVRRPGPGAFQFTLTST